MYRSIAVLGSSGAIGAAITEQLAAQYPKAQLHALSRSPAKPCKANITTHVVDYCDELSISEAAQLVSRDSPLDLIFIATGLLHQQQMMPEKSLREITAEKLLQLYTVNAVVPALLAKHFIPAMNKRERSVFAALSARVGSISDNQLGGWYSYRASKAALNMIIKTASVEARRLNPNALIVGLHPGTVDSNLSKPFQRNVEKDKLFTAEYSANCLITVLNSLSPEHTGRCFAWDGTEVAP